MKIKTYTPESIVAFVESDFFSKLQDLPISKHRALSQAKNPRADKDDKILFVAYEGTIVAGYLGVLPDLWYNQGKAEKAGWLSCIWVSEKFRSIGLAGELFAMARASYNNKILMTGMVPEIIPFYIRKGQMHPPLIKTGIRAYMRFNLHEILPPKAYVFRQFRPLLKVIDAAANTFIGLRLKLLDAEKFLPDLKFEYLDSIRPETVTYIEKHNTIGPMKRAKPELDWILENPWILQGDEKDALSKRYHFSSYDTPFFYQKVQFYDDSNEIVGFMLLLIRRNKLSVPYYYGEKHHANAVASFLIYTLRKQNLDILTVYNLLLLKALDKMYAPFIYRKKIENTYLISDAFDSENIDFQDGDGDVVFT
jgi:hypothetical protein